jgi:hypothetical protein
MPRMRPELIEESRAQPHRNAALTFNVAATWPHYAKPVKERETESSGDAVGAASSTDRLDGARPIHPAK